MGDALGAGSGDVGVVVVFSAAGGGDSLDTAGILATAGVWGTVSVDGVVVLTATSGLAFDTNRVIIMLGRSSKLIVLLT